jgi:hypothetical protein
MSDEQRQQIEEILAAYSYEQWDELIPEIQAVLETSSRAVAVEAVRQIFGTEAEAAVSVPQSVAIRGYFDQVNQDASNFARDRSAELVGRKWVNGELIENPDAEWAITDSTRDWLREEITSAFEDGMSPAELGKAIRESPAFTKSRAKMIAHTEIGNANMETLESASVKAGATDKRSFLSADHDHDDICDAAAEAGEVEIDFVYEGGFTRPLYHPRCQCSESSYARKKVPTQ